MNRVFLIGLAAAALLFGWINPSAAQTTIGGTVNLTNSSPIFVRPYDGCSDDNATVKYTTVEFYVETNGSYTFHTTGNEETSGHIEDPVLIIYTSPFDPTMPLTRCIGADDDSSSSLESSLTLSLTANTIYTAIITTYGNGATGLITWSASGAGNMHYVISVQKAEMSALTASGGTLTVQLSNPDTAYWVVLAAGATAPTAAQILAGHDGSNAAAAASGNFVVATAGTDTTASITGLASSTDYTVYVVSYNVGGGSGVRDASFMTVTPPGPVLVSSTPADGAGNVAVGSTIVLNFDQALTLGTGNVSVVNDTDATTEAIDVANPGTALAVTDMTVTITPDPAIAIGKSYHVEVASTALVGTTNTFAGINNATTLNFSGIPSDTAPDAFAFTPQTGAAPSTAYSSGSVTVSGINQPAAISVSGGTYAINAGTATADPGTVNEGDTVTVALTTSAQLSTPGTATLTIGGVSADFIVTTGDNNPLVQSMTFTGTEGPCTGGGVRILTGVDYDDSGTLVGPEIKQTNYTCNGSSGDNGSNGGTGTNGVGSLVETKSLDPDPDVCPSGGVEVSTGTDANHNGTLEDSEVSARKNICNGLSQLARSSALAAQSPACASGGVMIDHGVDTNGNGSLDDAEVTSSDTLCNGVTFAVRTTTIEPGSPECPAGGKKIETGLDVDGDLTLEDSEVKTSETLCDAVSILINTETLSSDPKVCPHGGLRVEIGRDDGDPSGTAADGTLQSGEVDSMHDVCLAATDVLIGGGSSSCSVRAVGQSGAGQWAWALFGLLAMRTRRTRRRRQLPTT